MAVTDAMRFDIRYHTSFTYDDLVRESQNELRACPASDDHQHLISYRVTTAPSSRVLSFADYWGTRVDAFGVRTPHLSLDVTAEASVETRTRPLCAVAPRCPEVLSQYARAGPAMPAPEMRMFAMRLSVQRTHRVVERVY